MSNQENKMKEVINDNNKYKWYAMLYIHGRKFMIPCVYLSRLSKEFTFCYLSKFGCQYIVHPKAVTISKCPELFTENKPYTYHFQLNCKILQNVVIKETYYEESTHLITPCQTFWSIIVT